jgi:3-methyladenine DNA glycosylase AlkD
VGPCFGVRYGDLGKLVKQIKVDHPLALELWKTGNHDARILATMIADPARTDFATLDAWAKDVTSYVLAMAVASVAGTSPEVKTCIDRWTPSKSEWVAATGWDTIAFALRDGSDLGSDELAGYLRTIEATIKKGKNRVRHSMNGALVAIGCVGGDLTEKAIAAARRIGKVEVDHGETDCKTPDAVPYIQKVLDRQKGKAVRAKGSKKTTKKTAKKKTTRKTAKKATAKAR